MKLVIIEGEGKKETITKYLKSCGKDYTVFATKGHIRDLPEKSLAINVKNNFEPKYVIMNDKQTIVNQLVKQAEKADEIFLATDPDREGEAISWHLANILNIPEDSKSRVVFNEISAKAVASAMSQPRAIDKNLVDAQQARRVLDRLVGYKLSPVLCRKIQGKLSAGRVQSVALRLVADKEREILAFKIEEYWTLTANLEKNKAPFKALLNSFNGKKIKPKNKEEMDGILSDLQSAEFIVGNVKKSQTLSHAPAPFITSTMQQDALNKLGLSLKQTSSTAQALYEGVNIDNSGKTALITYIRTDSTRVSEDAIKQAREFISEKFGQKFVPEKPNYYKSKKGAQDAHEAIRPINLEITPDSVKSQLPKNEYRLYKLIYDRFLASQMSQAEYDTVNVEINANRYMFKATGKTLRFAGFTAAYNMFAEEKPNDDDEDAGSGNLPELETGDKLKLNELKPEQKFTKPPARYTEASLVKAMEEKGIGRPATYTPTITTIISRQYVEKDGKYLKPTELGFQVTDMLLKYFEDIMDVGFTANMETKLDDIEDGGKIWQSVVAEFYEGFEEKIANAMGDSYSLKEAPVETDIVCEKCNSPMVIRTSKFGKFLACTGYPKCKNLKNLNENGEIVEPQAPKVSDETCPNCGSNLVTKNGRYGEFLACPNYPKCKYIKKEAGANKDGGALKEEGGVCPDCGGKLYKRKSWRGSFFYGCENYPKCKFLSNDPLTGEKCPTCNGYLVSATLKNGETVIKCGDKNCGYKK